MADIEVAHVLVRVDTDPNEQGFAFVTPAGAGFWNERDQFYAQVVNVISKPDPYKEETIKNAD